ncbi:MAG: tetratricopeptide repeat protein [bacterium]
MSQSTKKLSRRAAMVFAVFAVQVAAQTTEMRSQLLQRAFDRLHHEQYDSALADCAQLRQLYPDDPAGYLMAATIYQTMMRLYRVRIFETPFESMSRRAEELAEKQTRHHASAEGWFMLGSAKGNLALHRTHRGEWTGALRDAVLALHAMKRAMQLDPNFVDPGIALALYEYWKSKKLGMGLGLFAGNRKAAFALLEKVRAQGRYLARAAAFALQDLYMHEGEYQHALKINEELYAALPTHPSVLHHRAVILEKLQRPKEALAAWEQLAERLQAFQRPSHGFLAECQLHRAKLLEALQVSTTDETATLKISSALNLAASHIQQCDKTFEMEGPVDNFAELKKAIDLMLSKYAVVNAPLSEPPKP